MTKTLKVSWQEYGKLLKGLVDKLRYYNTFDYVTGITRGGLPIAVYLSHHLNISYKPLTDSCRNCNILLVDDISDTGSQLKDAMIKLRGNCITTATLFVKRGSDLYPDESELLVSKDTHVIFPYEVE